MTARQHHRDPLVLTPAEAAALCGTSRNILVRWLEDDPDFARAVLIDLPTKRRRISKPRLMAFLHGDAGAK